MIFGNINHEKTYAKLDKDDKYMIQIKEYET